MAYLLGVSDCCTADKPDSPIVCAACTAWRWLCMPRDRNQAGGSHLRALLQAASVGERKLAGLGPPCAAGAQGQTMARGVPCHAHTRCAVHGAGRSACALPGYQPAPGMAPSTRLAEGLRASSMRRPAYALLPGPAACCACCKGGVHSRPARACRHTSKPAQASPGSSHRVHRLATGGHARAAAGGRRWTWTQSKGC